MKPTKLILILFFIWCSGALVTGALLFAQSKLDVSGDIETPSLALTPQDPAPAVGPEGQIYYNEDNNQVYISDNTNWRDIAIPKNVATIIVAASDSLDPNKADPAFQCDGLESDGITPGGDQETIQAAIDAVPPYNPVTGQGGGVVYLLEGTYNISGSIVFDNGVVAPADGINDSAKSLIGAGAGTVLKVVVATSNLDVIRASSVNNILISRLMIDRNGINFSYGGTTQSAIQFSAVTNSKIDKVWIDNIAGTADNANFYGIRLITGSNNNIISNNHINDTGQDGVLVNNSSNNIISHNLILNAGMWTGAGPVYGIVLNNGANNNVISNNYIYKARTDGISIGWTSACNNNIVSGNQVYQAKVMGIKVANASVNNVITSNNVQATVQEDGIFIRTSNNIVSANLVQSSNNNGIVLTGTSGSNNIAFGNMCYEVGAGGYDGIHIRSSNNLVSSNYIYDSVGSQYGINVYNSTASNNYLIANYITGTGFSTKISDSGTNTKYTGKEKLTLEPSSTYYLESGTNTLRFGWLDTAPNPDEQRPAPISHLVFNETANRVLGTSGADAIEDGKSAGDLLILENSTAFTVTVPDDQNTALSATHILGQYDTLELIWNGNVWVEVSFTNVP